MDFEKKYLKDLDWPILLILVGLGIYSYLGISGSGKNIADDQIVWYLLGFGVLFATLVFDYRLIFNFTYVFYGIGILLLIGVFFTQEVNGVTSWYKIGSLSYQPAETMKLFTILTVARYMSKMQEKPDSMKYLYKIVPLCLLVGVPLLLILKQPDLGSSLVFIGIMATMLIVGGIRFRHVLVFLGVVILFFAFMTFLYHFQQDIFFSIIKQYQWQRITSWTNPGENALGEGYQLTQALIAIGSGQLTGKGLTTATQASHGWVPVGESDFIFTVIAERLGFIGAGFMMILFFLLIFRMIRIAMSTKDPFGSYVVSGVVGMLTFQIFENIGMTIQLMPITGIPLPFISYGGSSLLTNFLIIGVVLNIGMRKQNLRFD